MKLVILDRDGVINHDSAEFIKSPDEWVPIPGSLEAIARLNQSGYQVVLATNQSGVGRGLLDIAALCAIHDKMHLALAHAGAVEDDEFHAASFERSATLFIRACSSRSSAMRLSRSFGSSAMTMTSLKNASTASRVRASSVRLPA